MNPKPTHLPRIDHCAICNKDHEATPTGYAMHEHPIPFEYNDEQLQLIHTAYYDGCTAIQIRTEDLEPYATLSVHMPDIHPPSGTFYLKDWSENGPIAHHLQILGYLDLVPGHAAMSGHVFAEQYRIGKPDLTCQCHCKCLNILPNWETMITSFGICDQCDYCGPRHGCDHPDHPHYRPNWPN